MQGTTARFSSVKNNLLQQPEPLILMAIVAFAAVFLGLSNFLPMGVTNGLVSCLRDPENHLLRPSDWIFLASLHPAFNWHSKASTTGATPLHHAVLSNDFDTFETLLAQDEHTVIFDLFPLTEEACHSKMNTLKSVIVVGHLLDERFLHAVKDHPLYETFMYRQLECSLCAGTRYELIAYLERACMSHDTNATYLDARWPIDEQAEKDFWIDMVWPCRA